MAADLRHLDALQLRSRSGRRHGVLELPSPSLQDAVDPATGRQEPRPHRLRIGLYNFDDAGALVRTDSVETDVGGARTDVTGAGRQAPACPAAGQ